MKAIEASIERLIEAGGLSSIDMARKLSESEEIVNDLKATIERKTIQKKIVEIYTSFDELCFNMAEADKKMNPMEFKKLSAYEFLKHKELLEKSLLRKTTA